jgi:hypothetical protein
VESRILQILSISIVLFACSKQESKPLPFETKFLQNGDLVFRYGDGFFSKYFRKASDDGSYSHVGLVHITEDSIHIIHTEASEFTGIGYVRRDPLDEFMKNVGAWGIYRLDRPDSIRQLIIEKALVYHFRRVPFDLDFSLDDDKKLYCTELIAICVNEAAGEPIIKPESNMFGRYGYSITDALNPAEIRPVLISTDSIPR